MRCMSCLQDFSRREVFICNGCKARYCEDCHQDHAPCNVEEEVKIEEVSDDTTQEVERKPGIWIIKTPEAEHKDFDFWKYVA